MAAGINDKFKKTYNAANPNVARVTATRATAGTTLTCDNLAGWPTDTAVDFSTYKINTSNEVIAGTQIDWKGIVSGNNIGTLTRVTGAVDSGSVIGDVVEMNPTGNWANDLMTGILNFADQDGTLKAGAVDGAGVLASNVVTTAKILDANVTTAKVADDNITDAKLVNGKVYRRQGGDASNWATVGTTTYDTSGSDVKVQTGRIFNNASPKAITFPAAFTNAPFVMAQVTSVNSTSCFAVATGASTTGFSCQVYDNAGATNNAQDVAWIAIGI